MPPTYRVRYSMKRPGQSHAGSDVTTTDLQGELDQLPGLLPAGAYIMYIEDVAAAQNVHWTRWPNAFRPGYGG